MADAYFDSLNPPVATWHSLEDAITWYEGAAHQPGVINAWCTSTFNSSTDEPNFLGPSPDYSTLGNIWDGEDYTTTYNITDFWPACNQSAVTTMLVRQYRAVYCPVGSTEVNGTSCVLPGESPPKEAGQPCPCGPGGSNSGGADAGSAQTTQGNPINASTGNKYEEETDYVGVGSNLLKFTRRYNSLVAWAAANGQQYPMSLLGTGWSADYFQNLQVISASNGTSTNTTVFAYRPDGRVLAFNLYNGVYSPDGDVADSLAQNSSGGWVYQTNDDVIETYDPNGLLLSIARRGQAPVTVNHETGAGPEDPPTSVVDPFGNTLTFNYTVDATGAQRLGSITDLAGNSIQYAYNNGTLISVTYQDNTSHQYSYGSNTGTALTGLTDEAGNLYASWTYTTAGDKALSSQHAGGVDSYFISYATSGASGSVSVTDPLGQTRTFNQQLVQGVWRSSGVSAFCGECGEDAARTFDSSGNILSRTDLNGNQTVYTYDVMRNEETSRTEGYNTPFARTISTQWDPNWRRPAQVTEPNRTTAYTYDSMGNVLTNAITDTAVTNTTRTWTYQYDGYGRVTSAKDPRGNSTTYAYYACTTGYQCGQLQTKTDPAGHVWTYNSYNVYGQPLSITNPNGVATTMTYDSRSRLTSRTTAGETTSFAYYPTGLMQTLTLPDSSYLQYTYDPAHRLTQIADGLGNQVVYVLDPMGNRVAESRYDPSGVLHFTHTRVVNALNHVLQDINAAGTAAAATTYGYDGQGNQIFSGAPLSRDTSSAYDSLNRLTQTIDPANGLTQYAYDGNDNLISVTDPRSLSTGFVYSGFGDLLSVISPDTGITTDSYDAAGNVVTATDARGATATLSYDALNRVTSAKYARAGVTDQQISFTYDTGTYGIGHLTGATDANHSMSWAYDALGRVIGKIQTVGGITRSVTYAYTNGDLTSLTTPSGQQVTYGYNTNHQITSIGVNGATVLGGIGYEPLGTVNGWTWGNGTTTTRTYDTDEKVAQISSNGAETYGYDNALRIISIADTSSGSSNWTYGYDALDRLTGATNGTITRGWTYDPDGNRLTETGTSPATYSIAPGSNQLASTSGALARSYSYDAVGNVLNNSIVTATYNNRGRTTTLVKGSNTTTFIYDSIGERIESTSTAGTRLYVYDEAGHLIGEYDGGGNLIEETVWLGDIPVVTLQPSGSSVAIYYVHTDHLNTPRQVTRPSDNVQMWTWFSDPFGTNAANTSPAGAGTFVYNLRFPGQYADVETGLNYNYFRDYDPNSGRYVESDPIGLDGGSYSTYAYANGDPVDRTDPAGLASAPGRTDPWPGLTWPWDFPLNPPQQWINNAYQQIVDAINACTKKTCPPCKFVDGTIVPLGTVAYRLDKVPPSKPHYPFKGDHYSLYQAHQNPNNCQCFWKPIEVIETPPPPNAIPIQPFAN